MSEANSTPTVTKPIVVGVDGSENSKEALRWAVCQAGFTRCPVVAVISWSYPNSYGYPAPWPADYDPESDAKRVLDETVDEVVGSDAGVALTRMVLSGHPALSLEDLSHTASLVVVGSRGHGEFAGMLIGSVSEFLATHAHCPVVIIRSDG